MTDETNSCKVQAKFGRVSLGESTALIAVKIPRTALDVGKITDLLVDAMVDAELVAHAASSESDAPGQQVMDAATLRHQINAHSGRVGVGKDDYGIGLEMGIETSADVERLRAFIGKEGELRIRRTGDGGAKGEEE